MGKTAEIRRIPTDQLVAREYPNFKSTKILDVLDRLAWKSPLILKGPKGAGKTLNLEQWAYTRKAPFLRKSCTADTGDRQLLGSHTLKSFEESFFTLGCLSAAVDVANEAGRCMLVLEEINALNEEAQKVVNGIADYRKEVDLPHIGQVFRLAEPLVAPADGQVVEVEETDAYHSNIALVGAGDVILLEREVPTALIRPGLRVGTAVKAGQLLVDRPQLWVVGTMNPGYGGTYDLNEDFRSRFKFIEVNFMEESVERDILLSKFPTKATAEESNFVGNLQAMAKESRGGKYGYALSTRDLEQCVEDLLAFKDRALALKMLEGKFDAGHVADFRARVKSVFNIDVTTTSFWS